MIPIPAIPAAPPALVQAPALSPLDRRPTQPYYVPATAEHAAAPQKRVIEMAEFALEQQMITRAAEKRILARKEAATDVLAHLRQMHPQLR